MFEIIGLMIAIGGFLVISAILGGGFALLAWMLLRSRTSFKIVPVLGAGAVPVACALWIVVCVVVCAFAFPGKSYTLFGDIEEPLPNGYYLLALGKMPDFASIHYGSDFESGYVPLSKCVGGIAVDGPLIVGAYSHALGEFTAVGNQGFFLFDTRDRAVREYDVLPQIETVLGHPIHIVRTELFHSQQPFYLHDLSLERFLLFLPPAIAMLGYLAFLFKLRQADGNASTPSASF